MCDLYVVTVDTRGISSSDIKGYHEHSCSQEFFEQGVAGHPEAVCFKSEVADLCGLNLKIYFHNNAASHNPPTRVSINENPEINRGATLLTLDPETGFEKYHVRGIAYIVLDDGLSPLSLQQVWGIQELANYSKDTYKCDPEHADSGKRHLLRLSKQYRLKSWGPLTIYKSRPERSLTTVLSPPSVIAVKEQHSKRKKIHGA
jgi:hypothetical protein